MRQLSRLLVRPSLLASGVALAAWVALAPSVAHPADLSGPTVLAYYYAWYDPDSFANTAFQPPQPYNSDDLSTIQRHVSEASSAGIDGFVQSWYGSGDRTDTNFSKLLDVAQKSGFNATVDFETPHFSGADDVQAQLQAFYSKYINHPALVRYQGQPVIFFWAVSTLDNATWSAIRSAVDPTHSAIWMADGDNFNVLRGDAWDGISPYAIAWSANPAAQLVRWGNTARGIAPNKLWTPVVSPGCDDSAVRTPTCARDRGDGAYYQSTWDGALASNPSWAVVVSTFNEWAEATQIEPSVQYGDQYLQITRQNSDGFKGSAS
jgi:hypothetical protein